MHLVCYTEARRQTTVAWIKEALWIRKTHAWTVTQDPSNSATYWTSCKQSTRRLTDVEKYSKF